MLGEQDEKLHRKRLTDVCPQRRNQNCLLIFLWGNMSPIVLPQYIRGSHKKKQKKKFYGIFLEEWSHPNHCFLLNEGSNPRRAVSVALLKSLTSRWSQSTPFKTGGHFGRSSSSSSWSKHSIIKILVKNPILVPSYKFPLALSTISCLCDCPGGASQCARFLSFYHFVIFFIIFWLSPLFNSQCARFASFYHFMIIFWSFFDYHY